MSNINKIANNFEAPANLSLLLTIVWIIEQKNPFSSRTTLLIGQYAESKSSELEHNDLIESVLRLTVLRTENLKFQLEAKRTYSYNNNASRNSTSEFYDKNDVSCYVLRRNEKAIWFIDSLNSFEQLENDILNERSCITRRGYFGLVYTGHENSQMDVLDTIRLIFQRLFKIYIINIYAILNMGRETYVYTYLPFTQTKCHNAEPHLHAIFGPTGDVIMTTPEFFTNKLKNFWGCTLRVSTWEYPPFIIYEGNKIKGAEGLLMAEMAVRRNFTIENTTVELSGFLQSLAEDKINIAISALTYQKSRVECADAAYIYFNAPMALAIPKGRSMSPWERLLRPFKYIIWSCFSSSIVVGIIVIFSLKLFFKPYVRKFVFGRNTRTPFTNLWVVLYGVPIHGTLPRRNFARYLLAIWILYTWVLRSAYVGELFTLLQDSRARSHLKTVSEVIQNDFTIFTHQVWVPFLQNLSTSHTNVKEVTNTGDHSLPRLYQQLKYERTNFVVAVLEHSIRYFNKHKENKANQISILPETLFWTPMTFYMAKHSYLKYELDNLLLRIMSTGIIQKYLHSYMTDDAKARKSEQKEPVELSLWLLLGIFSVYLVLNFLSCLVFIFELRSRHSRLIRRFIDFVNY